MFRRRQKLAPAKSAVSPAPQQLGAPEYDQSVEKIRALVGDVPVIIGEAVDRCLALHADVWQKRDALSAESSYLLEQILIDYLPETLQQLIEARLRGEADEKIDSSYTAAQVAEQNIHMLRAKLETMLVEQKETHNNALLLQRHFLMQRLEIEPPAPSDEDKFALMPPKPEPAKEDGQDEKAARLREKERERATLEKKIEKIATPGRGLAPLSRKERHEFSSATLQHLDNIHNRINTTRHEWDTAIALGFKEKAAKCEYKTLHLEAEYERVLAGAKAKLARNKRPGYMYNETYLQEQIRAQLASEKAAKKRARQSSLW